MEFSAPNHFKSFREDNFEVRREESKQKVMLGKSSRTTVESSALAVQNSSQTTANHNQQKRNDRPWCNRCRKPGHTKDHY